MRQTESDRERQLLYDITFHGGSDGKASACNVGDPGSIPRLGRSPGERNGNPLQYSCLENSMDRGAWWATQSKGLQRGRTQLNDFTFFSFFLSLIFGFKKHNKLEDITKKRSRLTDVENRLVITSGEREGGGAIQGNGVKRYKLSGIK